MPQSLTSLLTHVIFSTKDREPLLTNGIASAIPPYIAGILNHAGCQSIQVGGAADHVHLFFRLSRTRSIAEVVDLVKHSSSKWVTTKSHELEGFQWQSGYGAFSVSPFDSDAVIAYIRNQIERHKTVCFQEEYRQVLQRYEIAYDEKQVWD